MIVVKETFFDGASIENFSAVWLHGFCVSEMCLRWSVDIPRFLDGYYLFPYVDRRPVPYNEAASVFSGAYIYFSTCTLFGFQRPIERTFLSFPACSYDASFYEDLDDLQLGTVLRPRTRSPVRAWFGQPPWFVSPFGPTVLTGGRPVLPDDAPLPPRTRVYFFNEDGYVGVREYPPITEYIDMLRDFDCGWPFPVAYYQLVLRTPLYFRREALNLGYRVRIAALSFRDLSQAQPLCVVDDSLLFPSRPYVQCLKATWMHTWQTTEHCFRWIADIPRFLSGKHIFCLLDGDCLSGEETYYVGQGSFFYLSVAQGDRELLIGHARSTFTFVC